MVQPQCPETARKGRFHGALLPDTIFIVKRLSLCAGRVAVGFTILLNLYSEALGQPLAPASTPLTSPHSIAPPAGVAPGESPATVRSQAPSVSTSPTQSPAA